MREIKLLSLALHQFKGMTFTFTPEGENSNIFGRNATGKTTIMDALTWLLFGKDSLGRADFDIKTLDKDGNAATGLDHSVEGQLSIDGAIVTLKRVFREIWTKKRGSAHKTFTGNKTEYFIDGVPVKQREYQERISDIAGDETTFRLLTSPTVFPKLHWEKQREIVMEVCGDVSVETILASNKNLEGLREILTNRTIEAHKKVVKASKSKINEKREEIPPRIDEVSRGMPDVSGLDKSETLISIEKIEEEISTKKLLLKGIDTGGDIAGLSKELTVVQSDMRKIVSDHSKALDKTMTALNTKISGLRNQLNEKQNDMRTFEEGIRMSESGVTGIEHNLIGLREEWQRVDALEFQDTTDDTCPACNQALPVERVHATREEARALFNKKKADDKKDITAAGHTQKAKMEDAQKGIVAMREKISLLTPEIEAIENDLNGTVDELNACSDKQNAYTKMPAYTELLGKEATLEVKIRNAKSDVSQDTEGIQEDIDKLEEGLKLLKQSRDAFDSCDKGNARIAELKAEERTLATEYEKLEQELFLTESFIRTKVSMLTEKINSNFAITRFKLFDELIGEGIKECCEITVDGVPYNGGLNSAARTNAGLDVCRTLMAHYGLKAPVFVDNAESVVDLIEMDTQVIRLVVSEDDKTLRIEKGE